MDAKIKAIVQNSQANDRRSDCCHGVILYGICEGEPSLCSVCGDEV